MKGWDRRALEGMPLKLLIMALMISLSAPAVLGSLDDFERSTARTRLVASAALLANEVEEVLAAGEGNRRSVLLTVPPSSARYGLAMEIGGTLDEPSSRTIRCQSSGSVFSSLVLDDPPGRMTTESRSSLRLEGGDHRLSIECVIIDGRSAVLLREL